MAVTGATKGTIGYTVKNIGSWVKSKFVPKSEKATYDTTTGTAYAGTPSAPQEPPTSIAYTGGGGGGRSGGGRSGGYTPVGIPTGSVAPSGVSDLSQVPTKALSTTPSGVPTELIVQARGGGVRVGQRTFIGKAEVPYTSGKTANQLRAEIQREARARGFKRGGFKATIPIVSFEQKEQQFQKGQASATGLLFGGGEIPTGAKGFFGRVKARGQERYDILKEGSQDITGTYGGTYIPPSPYESYIKGFFKEIPSSFPVVKNIGQDVKEFFQPQIDTAKIGIGVIGMGTKAIGKTPAYQKVKEWNAPRIQAVTSSAEFEVLSKSLIRGAAFTPARIVGKQVFVETIPLRQRRETFALEKIETQIIKGKPYRISDYTIYTEKAPPRLRITRKIYEAPKDITYLKEITSVTRTPYKASPTDSFITLEMKGGKVGSLSEVTGTSQQITRQEILSYQKLTPPRKLLVEQLAKAKAGSPVSPEYIPKILTEKDMRFFSQIDIVKLGKVRLTPSGAKLEPLKPIRIGTQRKPFKLYGEAKYSTPQKITRYEAITETKLIKETELYELTKSRVLFKDVTYPFARARGKTPELKVYTYEEKIPKIMDDFRDVQILKPADIKKTSLGKTFQVQIQKQPTLFIPPKKVPKAISRTKVISSAIETGQVVKQVSAFYGKGIYERTTGGQVPSVQLTPVISSSYTQPITKTYTPSIVSLKDMTILKTMPSMITKTYTRTITKPITKEIVKEITKVITKPALKVIQKPAQKLILKQAQKTIPKPASFIPISPTKLIPPRKEPPVLIPKPRRAREYKGLGNGYKVFGRRFGKFEVIGKARTPRGAVIKGKEWAFETLGVSFKVPSYKGSKVLGFRTKKEKGELIFIEPKRKRIKKRGVSREFKELKYWRSVRSPIKSIIKKKKKKK